jgi:TIR domain
MTRNRMPKKSSLPLIFISHDHRDSRLAEGFARLLKAASGGVLEAFHSSDRKGEAGIGLGAEWYPEIMSNLDEAKDIVVLLTPNSLNRPWILYEAGVAKGKLNKRVLGLVLNVEFDQATKGPFGQFQNCLADQDSLTQLVRQLIKTNSSADPIDEGIRPHVDEFLKFVSRPVEPTEPLSGPALFWDPHFKNGARNTILYSEPLCFRVFLDQDSRLFIRDIDINDTDPSNSDAELKSKLRSKFPWLDHELINHPSSELEVSRGYVPGGEVFAKDCLRDWLQRRGQHLVEQKEITKNPDCCEMVSHEAQWYDPPTRQRPVTGSLSEDNLIILGNSRSNPKMQSLQDSDGYRRQFRYRMEDKHIVIRNLSPDEAAILDEYKCHYERVGADARLWEDWKKESLALVTRGPKCGRSVITSVLANQGRGVYAVVEKFLTNDEQHRSGFLHAFKLSDKHEFPDQFQMLFRVELAKHEARYGACVPLLYSE